VRASGGILSLLRWQVIETPKRVHLVLDYVPAGTLGEYLRFRRRLPEGEAAHIFQQLCLAVAHCHARKVAHRDIKPENVMLLEDQSVVLVDFGLAHATGVKLKQQCGTPMFAAPEIWANVPYAGPPADVWSLGVSLYWVGFARPSHSPAPSHPSAVLSAPAQPACTLSPPARGSLSWRAAP
jgi:serine/threonine protein kinase